jgi:hypothetical protein
LRNRLADFLLFSVLDAAKNGLQIFPGAKTQTGHEAQMMMMMMMNTWPGQRVDQEDHRRKMQRILLEFGHMFYISWSTG